MGATKPHRTHESVELAQEISIAAGVAGRYAGALFEVAKEQGSLAAVEQDLDGFKAMLDESADLVRFVRSPVLTEDDQAKALKAILDRVGTTPLTANFLQLLVKNRRLFAVADMIKAFRALVARDKGQVTAEVASAHTLSPEQMTSLADTLKASIGKDVVVHASVDPSLIGGLVVKLGSRMIDSSIRTKLNALKVAMKGTG